MKKRGLLSIIILCLVLCVGCGAKKDREQTPDLTTEAENATETLSRDEVIKISQDLDLALFNSDYNENVLNAYDKYNGKYYKVSMLVSDIYPEEVWFTYGTKDGFSSMYISLDEDTLKKLKSGEYYTIAGKMKVDKYSCPQCTLENAYIIFD